MLSRTCRSLKTRVGSGETRDGEKTDQQQSGGAGAAQISWDHGQFDVGGLGSDAELAYGGGFARFGFNSRGCQEIPGHILHYEPWTRFVFRPMSVNLINTAERLPSLHYFVFAVPPDAAT